MLVIQNGAETIGNQYIATQLYTHLNNFRRIPVEKYFVDFTTPDLEIYDANDTLVYRANSDITTLLVGRDGNLDDYGNAILKVALDLKESKYKPTITPAFTAKDVLASKGPAKVRMNFGYLELDFNYEPVGATDMEERMQNQADIYAKIINDYNTRAADQPYLIVTGSFSKVFIEKFRQDLGADNVLVLNITRNPSAMYLMHFSTDMPADFDDANKNDPTTELAPRIFDASNSAKYSDSYSRHFFFNIVNSITVSQLPYAVNVKFEDIIRDGGFTFKGVRIPVEYTAFNNWITTKENDKLSANPSDLTDVNVNAANQSFSSFVDLRQIADQSKLKTDVPDFSNSNFPGNFFTPLGYSPLTRTDILKG